ncbi:MAG: Rrf2 family transcriptional regulator [Verrucomicrobiota bacterium]|jgi:Rrf2 family protein|nr:Rrf2 family transcriptional regulator [Verrucomicrobiota bacterium]MDD8049964.1 Rrf2 family transcriptional regulator [Verrucomicrobiota bacterium]
MLTQTSETAIRALIFIVLNRDRQPLPPRMIAERIEASPTYLSKTLRLLVKAGILQSVRGAHGGVMLARAPEHVTLLDIVEACQGLIVGNYCTELGNREQLKGVCAFHHAMQEIYDATVGPLRRWTLAQLAVRPAPTSPDLDRCRCKMTVGCRSLAEPEERVSISREESQ